MDKLSSNLYLHQLPRGITEPPHLFHHCSHAAQADQQARTPRARQPLEMVVINGVLTDNVVANLCLSMVTLWLLIVDNFVFKTMAHTTVN